MFFKDEEKKNGEKMKWIKNKTIISSIVGAVAWTICLTPYVVLITRMTWEQYISWLGMQFILVPIIAPVVFWITEKAIKYILEVDNI